MDWISYWLMDPASASIAVVDPLMMISDSNRLVIIVVFLGSLGSVI